MKSNHFVISLVSILLFVVNQPGYPQGSFYNLDFENPEPPLNASVVPISNALSGWTGNIGGTQVDSVFYNTVSIGAAAISLQGPGSLSPILQGSYSVGLQRSSAGPPTTAAVGQTGLIPQNTKSLTLFAAPGSVFQATFAGQLIPLFQIGAGPNYVILGGDISEVAGLTGELRFQGGGFLDNIQFSTQPIPEPSTLALLLSGGVFLVLRLSRQ
jgi:hypothetical protein